MTGRFAPSPTGDLHFGSLISAVASYADIRHHGGRWLLRIEDVDEQRAVAGAAERIESTLRAFGMESDAPVVQQSDRTDAYASAVALLLDAGAAFPCACTRSDLPKGGVYPGTCAEGLPPGKQARTIRLRVPAGETCFDDEIRGRICQDLTREVGAFVIRRADGFHAYQLAVVVDDAWQEVNRVVRGGDLLDSTPRQLVLQAALGFPRPAYAHHPVAVDQAGRKLGKSWGAVPVDGDDPIPALIAAWRFLGQPPDVPSSARTTVDAFWRWALDHWSPGHVPASETILAPS